MPVDLADSVKNPEEKALMMEVLGSRFTSGAMKLSATHRNVATEFNARVSKMIGEDPERAVHFTFKRATHVAEFATQQTTALATANCRAQADATVAILQQQGATQAEQIRPMQTHAFAFSSEPAQLTSFPMGASTVEGKGAAEGYTSE